MASCFVYHCIFKIVKAKCQCRFEDMSVYRGDLKEP